MERIEKAILRDVNLDDVGPKPQPPRNPVDHWSHAVLLERAAYLRKMARHGDGSASETLKEYPQHFTMLSFRSRSGEVEVHDQFADLFCVLAGSATLATGGAVESARDCPGRNAGKIDCGRHEPKAPRRRCGACAGRHSASDAIVGRRNNHQPGDEGAGSFVGTPRTRGYLITD
jgi:hypothetical protein